MRSKKKVDFELDFDDFYHMMQTRRCFYLGIFVGINLKGAKKSKGTAATVDRVDNNQGYTLINSALACKKANIFKGMIEAAGAISAPEKSRKKILLSNMGRFGLSKRQVRAILNKCPELNKLYSHFLVDAD